MVFYGIKEVNFSLNGLNFKGIINVNYFRVVSY